MSKNIEQAAKEFARKRLVHTDEFVDYDKDMYAAFIAGNKFQHQQNQSAGVWMGAKIVVWKDGSHKMIKDGITHEFESDKDWLTTINI